MSTKADTNGPTAAQKQLQDDVDAIMGLSESAAEHKSKSQNEPISTVPLDYVKPKPFRKPNPPPMKIVYGGGGGGGGPTVALRQTSMTQFQPKTKVQTAAKRKAEEEAGGKKSKSKKPRAKRTKKEKPAAQSTDGVVTNDDGTVTAPKKKKNSRYIDRGAEEAGSDFDEDAEIRASMKGEKYDSKRTDVSSSDDDEGGGGGGANHKDSAEDKEKALQAQKETCPGGDLRFYVPDVSQATLTSRDEVQVQFAIKRLKEAADKAAVLYKTLKRHEEGTEIAKTLRENAYKALKTKNLPPQFARLIRTEIEKEEAAVQAAETALCRTREAITELAVSSHVEQYRAEIEEVVVVADDFIAASDEDEGEGEDGDADDEDSADEVPGARRPVRPRLVRREAINIRAKASEMDGLAGKDWSKEVKSEYNTLAKRMLTSLRGDLHKTTDESYGCTDTQFEYAAVVKEGKMRGDYRVIVRCATGRADLTVIPMTPEVNGSFSDRDEWNHHTLLDLLDGWAATGFRSFRVEGLTLVDTELEELCWFGVLLIVQYHTIAADMARAAPT